MLIQEEEDSGARGTKSGRDILSLQGEAEAVATVETWEALALTAAYRLAFLLEQDSILSVPLAGDQDLSQVVVEVEVVVSEVEVEEDSIHSEGK